jgi:hypothetical protein
LGRGGGERKKERHTRRFEERKKERMKGKVLH